MFKAAFTIGIKPNELLDMPLWQFLASVEGYQDIAAAINATTVWTGYWSAYYASENKHKKHPNALLNKKGANKKSKHADTVDVDRFLAQEEAFNAKLRG